MSGVGTDPAFRPDLYTETASWYDEFRVPYPAALLDDLRVRAQVTPTSTVLDLGCGTGQVGFGLHAAVCSVLAVDQEAEFVAYAKEKAERLRVRNITWTTGRAEDVSIDGEFDLVTIGNAFHRLPRQVIAERATAWLRPGGCLALLWSNAPWDGELLWQQALGKTLLEWRERSDAVDRVPGDWQRAMATLPNTQVLQRAGFSVVGSFEFPTAHEWTAESLIGFVYSTSLLSKPVLGAQAEAFEVDVRARLQRCDPGGVFREEVGFRYDLARR